MEKKQRKYRRLRSLSTNAIIHLRKEKPVVKKVYDPSAWYVVGVRRHKELDSRNFLTDPKGFVNASTGESYHVEAYVATKKRKSVETIVIHGKIFVRIGEDNRIDILRKCLYLKDYKKDPSLARTASGFTDFARVPDRQLRQLQEILLIADGTVEYSEEEIPQVHDKIKLTDDLFAKSEILKDLVGTVEMINGKKNVTVILDKIGCFKFRLPKSSISRLSKR